MGLVYVKLKLSGALAALDINVTNGVYLFIDRDTVKYTFADIANL